MSYEGPIYPGIRNFVHGLRLLINSIPSSGRLTKKEKYKVEQLLSILSRHDLFSEIPSHMRSRIIVQISRVQDSRTRKTMHENLISLYRLTRVYGRGIHERAPYAVTSTPNTARTLEDLSSRIKELEQQISLPKITPEPSESEDQEITLDALKGKQILFGIMPFGIEFDDVWEGAIKKAANSIGFYPLRVDMLTESSNITEDITEAIKMSKLVVVDVSNNNPNVMFEFGYALALKKAPVVISRSTDPLPFDIQNIRTIFYQNNWKGIEKLREELQKFIKGTDKSKTKKSK